MEVNVVVPVRPIRVKKIDITKRSVRGRPSIFEGKKAVAAVLRGEAKISRFLTLQLVNDGYLIAAPIKSGKRGRPSYVYEVTSKGKGLVALSKNWFNKDQVGQVGQVVETITDNDIETAAEYIDGNDSVTIEDVLENFEEASRNAAEMALILEAEATYNNDYQVETVEVDDFEIYGPEASNDDDEDIEDQSEVA
jgi:predicted ArsR family transcriptional regulator